MGTGGLVSPTVTGYMPGVLTRGGRGDGA